MQAELVSFTRRTYATVYIKTNTAASMSSLMFFYRIFDIIVSFWSPACTLVSFKSLLAPFTRIQRSLRSLYRASNSPTVVPCPLSIRWVLSVAKTSLIVDFWAIECSMWITPVTLSRRAKLRSLMSPCGSLLCTVTFVARLTFYFTAPTGVNIAFSSLLRLSDPSPLGACLSTGWSLTVLILLTWLDTLRDISSPWGVSVDPTGRGLAHTLLVVTTS